MESSKRPFASGSRKAPDPYDQFLEQEGYYRKHVARDATCLFRVFSEQIFDVQMYHEKVRNDCIRWMRKKSNEYREKISRDFNDYLIEMSKPRCFGSFNELHALAHAYRRNVLLFEPFNLGTWFVKDDRYKQTVMVFFSPEKHFDSIFPTTFIQQAAYCQGLVYEILYVKVFKLPDVMYSVERMLHDPDGKLLNAPKTWDKTNHINEDRFVTSEGKQYVFNTAEDTNCVLDNYLLCHFHNKDNFDAIIASYRNKKNEYDMKEIRSTKTNTNTQVLINPMLCDSKISCVRQLLKEGITPFPYKVAKALDPNIYRNIEFDSWNEVRREFRYQKWNFDQSNIQVGAKCMVQLNDLDDRLFVGYVQEISPNKRSCVVYIGDLGECHTIPCERLQVKISSSVNPFKFRRSSMHHLRTTCNKYSRKKDPKIKNSADININLLDSDKYHNYIPYSNTKNSFCYTIADFTTMNNLQSDHVEVMVMPMSVEGCKSKLNHATNGLVDMANSSNIIDKTTNAATATYATSSVFDISDPSCFTFNNAEHCYISSNSGPYVPFTYHPYSAQQIVYSSHGIYPGAFDGVPYAILTPFGDIDTEHQTVVDTPNFHAPASNALNGSDLPLNDLITLRYFYNLGIDYFRHNQFRLEPPTLIKSNSSMDDGNEINELVDELNHSMTINTHNANDVQNKQLGFYKNNPLSPKREYGTKSQKNLSNFRADENKVSFPDSGVSANADQSDTSTANHSTADIPQLSNSECTLSYPHVPKMTPVRVPYYAFDTSHYMIPPYGTSLISPPPDVMIVHANPQLRNPLEAQYSPILFAPKVGTGFTFIGYPPQSQLMNYDGDASADNNFNYPD